MSVKDVLTVKCKKCEAPIGMVIEENHSGVISNSFFKNQDTTLGGVRVYENGKCVVSIICPCGEWNNILMATPVLGGDEVGS